MRQEPLFHLHHRRRLPPIDVAVVATTTNAAEKSAVFAIFVEAEI